MGLSQIPVPDEIALARIALPDRIQALLDDADARIAAYVERTKADPVIAFVPCDFPTAYRALAWIREDGLAPGPSFCEWGSGFGVVAMLAASLGFEATGIEVDAHLVEEAAALAEAHDVAVEFVEGSFIPEGSDAIGDGLTEFAWLDVGAPSAYETLGLDPEDFDLLFAYPWPGEQEVILDLFAAHASTGALLLTQQGTEGTHLHRNGPPRRRHL